MWSLRGLHDISSDHVHIHIYIYVFAVGLVGDMRNRMCSFAFGACWCSTAQTSMYYLTLRQNLKSYRYIVSCRIKLITD